VFLADKEGNSPLRGGPEIASSFNWHDHLFGAYYSLAALSLLEGRFDNANTHVELAKSHAVNSAYNLGGATGLQAISTVSS